MARVDECSENGEVSSGIAEICGCVSACVGKKGATATGYSRIGTVFLDKELREGPSALEPLAADDRRRSWAFGIGLSTSCESLRGSPGAGDDTGSTTVARSSSMSNSLLSMNGFFPRAQGRTRARIVTRPFCSALLVAGELATSSPAEDSLPRRSATADTKQLASLPFPKNTCPHA